MTGRADRQRLGSKLRWLYRLEAWLEAPMFLLALVWLWLFITELSHGLSVAQQRWGTIIWLLFILEYLLKLSVAPHKLRYIRKNTLTLIALAIPAFRAVRLLRALRLLRTARVVSTTRFVRALTSTRRLLTDFQEAQGTKPAREMNVGVLLALSPSAGRSPSANRSPKPGANTADLGSTEGHRDNSYETAAFTRQLKEDVKEEIENASDIPWLFHQLPTFYLDSETPQRPSAFLDEASRQMSDGPYDVVVVLTDVVLVSRRKTVQAGLVSPVSRTIVLSTRTLTKTPRDQAPRDLGSDPVRWNAACLLLHMLGHIAGLGHADKRESEVMRPFVLREQRHDLPRFNQKERALLQRKGRQLPDRELLGGGLLGALIFHVLMIARHPKEVVLPLLRSRSILLPFSLPSLSTAAVAPALVLVFNAEIWDVGFNMSSRTTIVFAAASIIGASFYLVQIQSLFFPRKEKQIVTEHLAVANGVIFLNILLGCIGLFLLVGSLMLLIEFYIFPADLMRTWPTLDDPEITLTDQFRLAAFISTIGVTTGALAGGLESRAVIQQLALFQDFP